MGLRINQNIAAMNSYRNLSVTDGQMAKSLEKLSSGFRINRAADDAAGLSISEGLRAQVGGIKVAVRNAQDAVSVVQTAEGALTETHSILQRMRDLAVQATNDGSQDADAQTAANTEFQQLKTELDRIAETTAFGTQKLLNGNYGTVSAVATGFDDDNSITVTTGDTFTIDVNGAGAVNVDMDKTATMSGSEFASYAEGLIKAALADGSAGGGTAATAAYADKVHVSAQRSGAGVTINIKADLANGETFVLTDTGGETPLAEAGFSSLTVTAAAGSGGTFQVGANNAGAEQITVAIDDMGSTNLGLATAAVDSTANAKTAIDLLDSAIQTVSNTRSTLGAFQNRFEHTINNLNVAVENLSASESRIRDTDMAQEMLSFTRSQILSQAGTAMLAQANQAPQSVLSLLR